MTALLAPLPADGATIVPMLTPSKAVDLFLGDLTRRSRSNSGRSAQGYGRTLAMFTDYLDARGDLDVTEILADHCNLFLDRHAAGMLPGQRGKRLAAGSQATTYSHLNSFLEWLYQQQRIKRNPLDRVARPRRIASEDLDVTSVSTADVPKLMGACKTDAERIAIAILSYLGPRRNAVAGLRLSDYDRGAGEIRFREKGSKAIWKPAPDELVVILEAAIARGALDNPWQPEDPYLIPPEGPLLRASDRDDRVIWRLVKRVAAEAGIEAHVHALRAAFATYYLEAGGNIVGLQELLGHSSIETTRIYLRKLDKRRAMEPVRALSWGAVGEGNMADRLLAQVGETPETDVCGVGSDGGGRIRTSECGASDQQRRGSKPGLIPDPEQPRLASLLERRAAELRARTRERTK
jgi:site-specific recombinase XerD